MHGEAIETPRSAAAASGHPRGLWVLAFTEAWERFSYYGMTALLVLYMVNHLLLPGHVEQIAGFAGFRGLIEGIAGPLTPLALASQIFGLYAGFVYFTPVLGGFVADRWLGQRNAVVLGALSMAGGHLAMTFERWFLLALLLLVIGSGLLKGNISAQVGALYPVDDERRRTRGYAIFSTAINVGAVVGPLLCGYIAQAYGWHYGFGIAAIFMLGGLATYLVGYRHLPARVARRERSSTRLRPTDWTILLALFIVMAITILQSVSYYQLGNVFSIWIQEHVDLRVGGASIPIPWFQSIDPLASIAAVPLLFAVWKWQAAGGGEPDDLAKIGIGAAMAGASNLLLVAAIMAAGGSAVHWIWPVVYCTGMGIAFVYYWPTLLALVSRAAPPSVNATMMGLAFLTLFVGNNAIGWLGRYYETMGPAAFWGMHAAIGFAGAALVLLLGKPLRRVLGATSETDVALAATAIG